MDESTRNSGYASAEELFHLLAEHVTDYAILFLDGEGRVRTWTTGAERVLGYRETEILGQPVSVFFTPEDAQAGVPQQEMEQARSTGRGEDDRWHVRKDGTRFWASGMMTPLWDESGNLRGYAKIMRDGTEWKRAEQARKQSEASKAAVLETALDGIITIDHEDRIVEFNPAAERLFGYRRAEVLGQKMGELIVPAHLRAAHYRGMARYLSAGEGPVLGKRIELSALRADGTEIPVELAIVRVPTDEAVLFTGYVRDISARKAQECRRAAQLAVTEVLAEAPTVRKAAARILEGICCNLGWDVGGFWLVDEQSETLRCVEVWHPAAVQIEEFVQSSRKLGFAPGDGLPGRVWGDCHPHWVADVLQDQHFPRLSAAAAVGLHAAFAVPLTFGGQVLGVIEFLNHSIEEPDTDLLGLMTTIGGQIGQFMQRKQAEAALRDSEQRFRGLMEQAPFSIQIFSPTGQSVEVNRAWEELWGVTLDQIEDYNITQDPQLEAKGVLPQVQRAFSGETVAIPAIQYDPNETLPDRTRHQDPCRWVSAVAYPLKDRRGGVREVVVVHEDITVRKRAEDALRESEERFRGIVAHSVAGVAEVDLTGRFLFANEQYCTIVGRSLKDLLQLKMQDISHQDDLKENLPLFEQIVRDGTPYVIEKRYLRPDGAEVWVNNGVSGLRGPNGEVHSVVAVCVDITGRRRAEEALRQAHHDLERRIEERTAKLSYANRFLRALLESVQDGIVACNAEGKLTLFNRAAVEFHGLPQQPTPADDWAAHYDLFDANGSTRINREDVPLFRALKEEPVDKVEMAIAPKNGPQRTLLASGRAFFDEQGNKLGAVVSMHDITERKQAEEALRRAHEELEQRVAERTAELAEANKTLREADQSKDEFLAMLAHELRNPLAPIRSGLDLLELTESDGEVVNTMQQQVEHLVRLVDDLLDVSRIMRGRIELRREPVELASVVERAVETARPLIDSQGHQFTIDLPSESITLSADPVRLTQVIDNLLHNAAKYTPSGGRIWLTARRDGDEAVVSVRDSGIGIEPDLLPHVFDLFRQSERSLDRSHGGLGIGLTVVKRLVEMHNGNISVQSEGEGKGSEFTVRLPALAESPGRQDKPQQAVPTPAQRILIVDDNVAAANMLKLLLGKLGRHEIFTAHDGPSALESAKEHQPDIILLDIGLPQMDGFEVARRLREQPEFEQTLVVALTGYGTNEDRRKSLHAGCDEHLVKPPGVDALKGLLARPKPQE